MPKVIFVWIDFPNTILLSIIYGFLWGACLLWELKLVRLQSTFFRRVLVHNLLWNFCTNWIWSSNCTLLTFFIHLSFGTSIESYTESIVLRNMFYNIERLLGIKWIKYSNKFKEPIEFGKLNNYIFTNSESINLC